MTRRSEYRDPLLILLERESRTCRGCVHKTRIWGVNFCELPERHGSKADRRCNKYQEKGVVNAGRNKV
jgi:hypothetical protein